MSSDRPRVILPHCSDDQGACADDEAAGTEPHAPAALPTRYRDFKVYVTSDQDPQDAATVTLTLHLINDGSRPLNVRVQLEAQAALTFAGETLVRVVSEHASTTFALQIIPVPGFRQCILTGRIEFGSLNNGMMTWQEDRALYVAVHGSDPDSLSDPGAEPIQAVAAAVAAYAPRTHASTASHLRAKACSIAESRKIPLLGGEFRGVIIVGVPAYWTETAKSVERTRGPQGSRSSESDLVDAVQDLVRCLERKTGFRVPVAPQEALGARTVIRLLLDADPGLAQLPDGYHLTITDGGVRLAAATIDGLCKGVYGLLTDHLDCHWFLPGGIGEEIVVPADGIIRVAPCDERRGGSFASASGMSWGRAPTWDRRSRSIIASGALSFGHAWNTYINTQELPFNQYPQFWARDREGAIRVYGEQGSLTNLCSTNPQVLRIVADKINAVFAAQPEAIIASIDPNSYAPMCLCKNCLAVDRQYGQMKEDGTAVADRLIHFAREVHSRLEPRFQDRLLGMMIYGHQKDPPISAVPHPSLVGVLCDYPPVFDHSRPWSDPSSGPNREFARLVKSWSRILPRFGFYDYYGHYSLFGPWALVHKLREDLPAFRESGGTFVMIEAQPNFGMQGLNLYVAARLIWDLNTDVDLLVEEFMCRFYGPVADPMRQFWAAAERWYALARPGTGTHRIAADPAFWAKLAGYVDEARAMVKDLPSADVRFAERVAYHADAFELGRWMDGFRRQHLAKAAPLVHPERAIEQLLAAKPWLEGLQRKYLGSDAYYPTIMAPYYFPQIDKLISDIVLWRQDTTRPVPKL